MRVWLGSVLRRNGPATIGLVLVVGLGAGVAMATVAAGRKASTSYDRFLAYADPRSWCSRSARLS